MSTANKLTYLNGTKQALKESINNIGGSITNETTFREYAEELQDIYDNIPKTTDTGTNLSLNTIKGKMNIIPKGDTSQATRQYIDVGTWEQGDVSGQNGNNSPSNDLIRTDFIAVKPSILYHLNRTIYSQYMYFRFYDSSKGFLGTQLTSGMVTTDKGENRMAANDQNMQLIINNTNVAYMRMVDRSNDLSTKYTIYTDNTPSPSYPQDIEVVTGIQEVKVENVNLLKDLRPSTQTLNGVTYTNNGNGTFKINGTSSAYTQFVDSDSFTLPKGTYTLSGRSTSVSGATMQLRSPDGYTIITQSNTKTAFTLSEDTQVRFRIVVTANITYSNAEFEPMILSGDVTQNIPTYVEHAEQTQTISLGNIELCKIGNYQDYLYKSNDKWYKKEQILSFSVDNNTTFNKNDGDNTNYLYYVNKSDRLANTDIYSNTLKQTTLGSINGGNTADKVGMAKLTTGTLIYVNVGYYISSNTATAVKEFLISKNTKFYYVASTPQDIEITDTTLVNQLNNLEKMYSYNGTTNISNSGNLAMVLSVSALKGES